MRSWRGFAKALSLAAILEVGFWRKSNKPPFDSLQRFLGFHGTSGITARPAASSDPEKNQPIAPQALPSLEEMGGG
jgi:hypothetical protein